MEEFIYLRSHSRRSPVQIVPVRRPDEIHAGQLTAAQLTVNRIVTTNSNGKTFRMPVFDCCRAAVVGRSVSYIFPQGFELMRNLKLLTYSARNISIYFERTTEYGSDHGRGIGPTESTEEWLWDE